MIDQEYYKEGETYFLWNGNGECTPVVCDMVSSHQATFIYIEAASPKEYILDSYEFPRPQDQKSMVSKYPFKWRK